MGEVLEIAKVLVEPTTKLIDAVQGAIGKAYEPRHIKKLADARAHEISVVGQAMREASDIPIVYKKGDIELDTSDFDAFLARTQNRLAYQELAKQHNIESVVNQTYQMLEGESLVTSEPVDQGWMLRFIDSIQDISDSDLQQLWAKILSGEVKQPKSFSLRTLEVLRNISIEEAKLFEQLCNYVIKYADSIYFFPRYTSLEEAYKIYYGYILALDECGLVNASGSITLNIPISEKQTRITDNKKIIIMATAESGRQEKLTIEQYPLTAVGVEIFKLFEHSVSDEFLLDFARVVQNKTVNFKISAYHITEHGDDYIRYEENDLLADNKE